ncbi:MAG: methyltransferase [Dehalococcoidia bacterium]
MAEPDAVGAPEPAPAQILLQAMTGYVVPQALYAAVRLGIADELASGSRDVADLARLTGAQPRALLRLLRALCSAGVFSESDGLFAATNLGRCLARDSGESVYASVLVAGAEQYRAWAELLHSVQTGSAAFEHVFGVGCYDYLAQHPEAGRLFDASMTETGADLPRAVLAGYDFSAARIIVDVGGGHGALLSALLQAYPAAHGILFDLPAVVSGAEPVLQAAGIVARCTAIGGSFFDAVPTGGDVYVLARTLLNWEESRVITILRRCREAMTTDARLLVVEPVLPAGPVAFADAFNDLNLLVLGGGGMYTEVELRALFAAAGLRLLRVHPTGTRLSLIEGAPVDG